LPERDAPWSLARVLLRAALGVGVDVDATLPRRSREALGEVLPELAAPTTPAAFEPGSRRALALEAAVRLVAAIGPALVLVDDVQWADASSLALLATTASRAEAVVLVLAYRPEEVAADLQLAAFLSDLRATSAPVDVALGPLDAG